MLIVLMFVLILVFEIRLLVFPRPNGGFLKTGPKTGDFLNFIFCSKICKNTIETFKNSQNIANISTKMQKIRRKHFRKISPKFNFFSVKLILRRSLKAKVSFAEKEAKTQKEFLLNRIKAIENFFIFHCPKLRATKGKILVESLAQFCVNKIALGEKINPIKIVNKLKYSKKIYKYELVAFYYFFAQYLIIFLAIILKEVRKNNKMILSGQRGKVNAKNFFEIYGAVLASNNAGAALVGLNEAQIVNAIRQTLISYQIYQKQIETSLAWLNFLFDRQLIK